MCVCCVCVFWQNVYLTHTQRPAKETVVDPLHTTCKQIFKYPVKRIYKWICLVYIMFSLFLAVKLAELVADLFTFKYPVNMHRVC